MTVDFLLPTFVQSHSDKEAALNQLKRKLFAEKDLVFKMLIRLKTKIGFVINFGLSQKWLRNNSGKNFINHNFILKSAFECAVKC